MKKFFWIAIAVILLLLGVLVWQIRGSRTMNDPQILTKLVAEPIIYDSDGLVDFASMLNVRSARDVQPEENAFIDYARILGPLNRSDAEQIELCKLLQVDSLESPQPYVGVSAALGPNGPGNEPQAWDQVVLRPWTNEAFPNHAKWLEQNAGHVVAIHAAARKPKYFYPLQPRIDPGSNGCRVMNCTLEYTQQMRELARLLSAHAMNLVGRGELRSAFQDLESIHRMAAQVGQGPFLIEKMVAIAIDGYAFAAAPALLESPQLTPADLSD